MTDSPETLRLDLEHGEIELKGQFTLGSNYTFLVSIKNDGRETPAVYKPRRGEQTLWDFPEASLAGREGNGPAIGIRPMAGSARSSFNGASDGESNLETSLWHGHCQDVGEFRPRWLAANASGTARLAGP